MDRARKGYRSLIAEAGRGDAESAGGPSDTVYVVNGLEQLHREPVVFNGLHGVVEPLVLRRRPQQTCRLSARRIRGARSVQPGLAQHRRCRDWTPTRVHGGPHRSIQRSGRRFAETGRVPTGSVQWPRRRGASAGTPLPMLHRMRPCASRSPTARALHVVRDQCY